MTTVNSFKRLTVAVLAAIGFAATSANAAHESNWIFPNFAVTDGTTLPEVDAGVEGNSDFEGVAMTRKPVQQPNRGRVAPCCLTAINRWQLPRPGNGKHRDGRGGTDAAGGPRIG